MSGLKPKSIKSSTSGSQKSTMRVAIAGTGGLAWWIAHHLHEETSHQLLWLSRSPKPHLTREGYQIMAVDYGDPASLEFALRGVDVVISTVPGIIQCRIIDAAIRSGVKRFAPAEFEGLPDKRTTNLIDRSLDRGKTAVLAHLHNHRPQIEWTAFVCGLFYERFAPGGLQHFNMGIASPFPQEGDYMVNIQEMRADVPYINSSGQQVAICMTSASDFGRFVVQSLDIKQQWPRELIMRGDRLTTYELLGVIARVRGRSFEPQAVVYHNPQSLQNLLADVPNDGDTNERQRLRDLLATQEGRYDYPQANLNAAFPGIVAERFEDWLRRAWSST